MNEKIEPASRRTFKLGRRAGLGLLVLSTLASLVYGPALLWGRGERVSFSPDTLRLRFQQELRLPYLGWLVFRSPVSAPGRNTLLKSLADAGALEARGEETPHWVLIGHASQLCDGWDHIDSSFYGELVSQEEEHLRLLAKDPEGALRSWKEALKLVRKGEPSGPCGLFEAPIWSRSLRSTRRISLRVARSSSARRPAAPGEAGASARGETLRAIDALSEPKKARSLRV